MTLPEILALVEQYRGWLGAALIAGWVLYHRGWLFEQFDRLKGMLPKWSFGTTTKAPPEADDTLATIRRLRKQFKDKPEALAALKVVWTHLLDVDEVAS